MLTDADTGPERLRTLFLMSQEDFQADAERCYALAWAIVHGLVRSNSLRMRQVLPAYLDALRGGASIRSAYETVLAPIEADVSRALRDHLAALRQGREED